MGGASDGLTAAGFEVIGVEYDATAAESHELGGHATVHADSTSIVDPLLDLQDLVRNLESSYSGSAMSHPGAGDPQSPMDVSGNLPGELQETGPSVSSYGLWLSPPCQAFSIAGKGEGVKYKDKLRDCINDEDWSPWPGIDPNIWLPLEVGRWTQMLQPRWVLCEQVMRARELWKMYEEKFQEWGYSTWSGVLNCADYSLPQTRKRAFFMASLDGPVRPPKPTHAKDGKDGLLPWVTMADALGWGATTIPYPTIASGRTSGGGPDREKLGGSGARKRIYTEQEEGRWISSVNTGADHREKGNRDASQKFDPNEVPAKTFTTKSGTQWKIEPTWPFSMPATTVCADPRITSRSHHYPGDQGKSPRTTDDVRAGNYTGKEPVKLKVEEALVLQGFAEDRLVAGSKTAKFKAIGNAVPPIMAKLLAENLPDGKP